MSNKNTNLIKANKAKNDEFYTQLSDIEAELKHYEHHFKDKIVYCNCDNPEHSNFWKYFVDNFERLGLNKVVSTYYIQNGQPRILVKHKNGLRDMILRGDGDFRSEECIGILKKCDIVVTNPPFSLFREYVAQLMEYDKKFLIIRNMNAITYKEIFPLIKDNKIWFGYNFNKSYVFKVPENYISNKTDEHGNKIVKVPAITWYTNLDNTKRNKPIELINKYNEIDYPKYDNYDAINVDKTKDIPYDYYEAMGVPVSFLNKYCPEQFEIIGHIGSCGEDGYSFKNAIYINGKKKYKRILIKRKQ